MEDASGEILLGEEVCLYTIWRPNECEEMRQERAACYFDIAAVVKLDPASQTLKYHRCKAYLGPSISDRRFVLTCLAAHNRDIEAQIALGYAYQTGRELVAQDGIQAYKWLALADHRGQEFLHGSIGAVASQMTPDQIAEAERLVAEWEPNSAECAVEGEQAEN
jgi:TPR repeat protein